MTWATIVKSPDAAPVAPSLLDYERVRATFAWAQARAELDGLPGGRGLNIAHEAVDRHAAGARRDRVALRWLGKRGEVEDITYGRLSELTARFANVLRGLGVAPGERVYALAGRIPALYVAALGALKARAVFCPLFSAFGPEPIRARLAIGEGRVLVTTEALYRRKVAGLRAALPRLEHVLLVGAGGRPTAVPDTRDWHALMNAAADRFEIEPTDPEDTALLHFTSGTTGTPKGAVHVHEAVVAHHVTGRWALDLHPEDVFWCAAEPGGRGVGAGGARAALPRQLVADGDGRDHDRQPRGAGHPAGLDGPAAARGRGGDRPARRRRPRRGRRGARRPGRAGAAGRLAVDVPRLLGRAGALPEVLRRRLVPHRRPRAARPRRLLLVRRARRRRHQDLGPPGRPLRGRERPDGARGRRRGRRHRQARPGRAGGGQGLRRPQGGLGADAGAQARAARVRAHAPGRGGRAEGDRLRAGAAEDAEREDHAPALEGARARAARGRRLDARGAGITLFQREHALGRLRQMVLIRRFQA